jgi:hypothetical protein
MGGQHSRTPSPYGTKPYAIWEAHTGEGSFIAQNGDTTVICNPGDDSALRWVDEDDLQNNNLHVGWHITVSGDIIKPSDSRLKTDIVPLNINYSDVLEKFKSVNFVQYKRKRPDGFTKQRNKYNHTHYGVIAQEIERIFPETVLDDPKISSFKAVEYNKLQMIANVVIQKQQKQIEDLIKRVEELEKKYRIII